MSKNMTLPTARMPKPIFSKPYTGKYHRVHGISDRHHRPAHIKRGPRVISDKQKWVQLPDGRRLIELKKILGPGGKNITEKIVTDWKWSGFKRVDTKTIRSKRSNTTEVSKQGLGLEMLGATHSEKSRTKQKDGTLVTSRHREGLSTSEGAFMGGKTTWRDKKGKWRSLGGDVKLDLSGLQGKASFSHSDKKGEATKWGIGGKANLSGVTGRGDLTVKHGNETSKYGLHGGYDVKKGVHGGGNIKTVKRTKHGYEKSDIGLEVGERIIDFHSGSEKKKGKKIDKASAKFGIGADKFRFGVEKMHKDKTGETGFKFGTDISEKGVKADAKVKVHGQGFDLGGEFSDKKVGLKAGVKVGDVKVGAGGSISKRGEVTAHAEAKKHGQGLSAGMHVSKNLTGGYVDAKMKDWKMHVDGDVSVKGGVKGGASVTKGGVGLGVHKQEKGHQTKKHTDIILKDQKIRSRKVIEKGKPVKEQTTIVHKGLKNPIVLKG